MKNYRISNIQLFVRFNSATNAERYYLLRSGKEHILICFIVFPPKHMRTHSPASSIFTNLKPNIHGFKNPANRTCMLGYALVGSDVPR